MNFDFSITTTIQFFPQHGAKLKTEKNVTLLQ